MLTLALVHMLQRHARCTLLPALIAPHDPRGRDARRSGQHDHCTHLAPYPDHCTLQGHALFQNFCRQLEAAARGGQASPKMAKLIEVLRQHFTVSQRAWLLLVADRRAMPIPGIPTASL